MKIKILLMLSIALLLVFALASCGGCDQHVDENGDSVCDKCDEYFTVNVKFSVKFDNGNVFSKANLVLEKQGKTIEVPIDANGNGSADVPAGLYYVSFDGPYVADVPGVKIEVGTTTIELTVVDNTPDGSASKPFFISERENQVTLAPGQEIFYTCHASSEMYIRVYSEYATVSYNGETHQFDNGLVEVLLEEVEGGQSLFSIKNISHSQLNTTFYFEAPLGSQGNPIILSENSITKTVYSDCTIYYRWTAYKDGNLALESATEGVEVSLMKILEGDVPLKSETSGTGITYMDVLAGDVIIIEVSVKSVNSTNPTQIQISLTIN